MLTAILTHHLGWVPTVSPFSSTSSSAAVEQRAKLLQVSQKHPYNALWAQMGDLFGAIGIPPKLARTVIYGTEKLSVERLLNVLTYFIRCGEVRRSSKKEDFNKETINDIVAQARNETFKKSTLLGKRPGNEAKSGLNSSSSSLGKTLSRSQTCKQNLSLHGGCGDDNGYEFCEKDEEYDETDHLTDEAIRTYKKNEIPTVLAFRDSRFVKQELRIGNYLMDTGIEKNSLPQYQQTKQKASSSSNSKIEGRIRLTLTTPDNEELIVEDTSSVTEDDGVMEAIEIETLPNTEQEKYKPKSELANQNQRKKKPFFWSMTSDDVKEGLSLNDVNKMQQCLPSSEKCKITEEKLKTEETKRATQHLSLSDLITQNSMGKSDCPMTWGIEPVKENVSLEEQIHFDFCQKLIEREHGICRTKEDGKGVVFVLGDNEPLVNIKRSTEDLSTDITDAKTPTPTATDTTPAEQLLCPLHQRLHNPLADATSTTNTSIQAQQQQIKKHSGVKFNFEQYPQIVTNYMKSKNLHMTNYDLLMDKCSKLEAQSSPQTDPTQQITNTFPQTTQTNANSNTTSSNCIVCKGLLSAYQTPSNATELEFEIDEVHGFANKTSSSSPSLAGGRALTSVSSQASVQTLISGNEQQQQAQEVNTNDCKSETSSSDAVTTSSNKKTFNTNQKKCSSQRGSVSSVAAKCAAVNEAMHLLQLPIPAIKELPQEDELTSDMKLPVGFIPSLFLSVNDHYVPDMVLQVNSKIHIFLMVPIAYYYICLFDYRARMPLPPNGKSI